MFFFYFIYLFVLFLFNLFFILFYLIYFLFFFISFIFMVFFYLIYFHFLMYCVLYTYLISYFQICIYIYNKGNPFLYPQWLRGYTVLHFRLQVPSFSGWHLPNPSLIITHIGPKSLYLLQIFLIF